jgi:branched-chain amino acid transport system permease protein
MLIGVAPLSNIDYHTSETLLIMTIIGGAANLFASLLGAGAYLLAADALSAIWPRWLLLLGLLLIVITLFLQRGLWGLIEHAVALVTRAPPPEGGLPLPRVGRGQGWGWRRQPPPVEGHPTTPTSNSSPQGGGGQPGASSAPEATR